MPHPPTPLCPALTRETLQILRSFDLDPTFGPCAGSTRAARWQRAHKLGLAPPAVVKQILDADKSGRLSVAVWDVKGE